MELLRIFRITSYEEFAHTKGLQKHSFIFELTTFY